MSKGQKPLTYQSVWNIFRGFFPPLVWRVRVQPQTTPRTAVAANDGRIFARMSAPSPNPEERRSGDETTLHSVCRPLRLSASEKGAFSLPMLMLSAPTRLLAHGDDSTLVRAISEGPKMAVALQLFGVAGKS